ncbi:lipopolysaccharide export system ATP-binding protein [Methylohalomonas lacus]|uniref:Lipopolysaccharide export system ATP-binding protein LptB n=1 Tax=Methylohalomonas lacus TaxID=398773 RepID=A0AAE3HN13_9GAMM|nr:LPS export ABC transporter ATP-binding protein [Methylohalomonas lacus]MCS3904207.1 lipopolysaccharide export system ATP-binding protein [Methylohalomonas lacus]
MAVSAEASVTAAPGSELSVRNLSKTFKSRPVVKDVSLNVHSGEIVGLLGPNGAGKTTSFHMIVGLIPADTGSIFLNDTDLSRLPIDQRAQLGLGYLPQEPSIFRKLTVADNIMAILQTRPDLSPGDREQRLEDLLTQFHVARLRDSVGASLSGGERRRVEIARALAMDPLFLLLDEPFAGIDPISISDIQAIIRRLSEAGIGILITDHNVRETLGTCHRAYIVSDGQIIAAGEPDEILSNNQVREVYLGEHFRL